jgi:type II secretory pathway pseudopilin PulG
MLKKGVAPIITTVLIIFVSVIVITLVLLVGLPAIQRAKESGIINEAMQNMRLLDNLIREVASEGVGSLRTMQLRVSGGTYTINEKTNSIDFVFTVKSGIIQPGAFIQEGNLIMSAGANARAREYDLDGDGETELVLENEILRIGIKKVGSRASPQSINTSELIKILNFKENNANVTPSDSSIFIDDFADSYYGTGYTELVRAGDHLTKAEAIASVNSTFIYYEVLFTLQSGADFLLMKVQNAYYK